MNVLQVCAYLYPALQYGGPAKVVYDLSCQLSKNHNVTILTSDVWNKQRRIKKTEKLTNTRNFEVVYCKNIFNSLAYSARFFSCFGMIPYFLRHSNKFKIIHIHDIFIIPQLIIGYFARVMNIAVVISPHGILDPVRMQKKSFIKSILYQLLVRPLMLNSQQIIATSDKEKNDLNILGYVNVTTVWNGIPVHKVKSTNNIINRKLLALYVGKLHPQKGVVEAVSAAKTFSDGLSLLIAGPDDGALNDIKKVMNNDQTKIIGYVNDSKKRVLFSKADFFIYPSYSEGFSISILEALSAGIPVVITTGCNFPLVEKYNAGIVISVKNLEDELTKAFDKILKHPKSLSAMRVNAVKLINDHFTIQQMAKNMERVYDQV